MQPWELLLIGVAGWMNREQQQVIDYLLEENRVLREQAFSKQALRFLVGQPELSRFMRRYFSGLLMGTCLLNSRHPSAKMRQI